MLRRIQEIGVALEIASIPLWPLLCAKKKTTRTSSFGPRTNGKNTRPTASYETGTVENSIFLPMKMVMQLISLDLQLCRRRHGNSSRRYTDMGSVRRLGVHEEQKRPSISVAVCVAHFQNSGGAKVIGRSMCLRPNIIQTGPRMLVVRGIYVYILEPFSFIYLTKSPFLSSRSTTKAKG